VTIRSAFLLSVLCVVGVCAAMPAQAGLFDDDEARKAILDLRAKVEINRKALEDKAKQQDDKARAQDEELAQLRRSILDLSNQNEQLKADIARLRGATEQQGFSVTTLSNDVAALQKAQKSQAQVLDDRVRQLEPQVVVVDGRQVTMDQTEKRSFDAALAAFKGNDFTRATTSFNEFNTRYPNSAYAPQSHYWLGNAYYALKDCRAASDAFNQLATRFPSDGRAAESLLSVGNCQLEMNDKRAARRAYESIIKLYPGTEEAATAKERLARVK
jgi:tol-pal system protein YbgF